MILSTSLVLAVSPIQRNEAAPSTTGISPFVVGTESITFSCSGGTIALSGSRVCSNQVVTVAVCGVGTCNFAMLGTPNSGRIVTGWTATSPACLGSGKCSQSSTSNPVNLWIYCTSTCTGGVTLKTTQAPADYVTLSCVHGSISINGSKQCADQSSAPFTACGSSPIVCSYSITATVDSGNAFANWAASGDSCLGTSPTCATLSGSETSGFWATGGGSVQSGTLTLSTDAPPSCTPSTNEFVVHIYNQLSVGPVGYVFASPEVLTPSGTYLSNLADGAVVCMSPGDSTIITAEMTDSSYGFYQWSTTAGSVASVTSSPTTFTADGSGGALDMVSTWTDGPWAGYVQSAAANQASGQFTVPSLAGTVSCSGYNCPTWYLGIWVGIGGTTGTSNLWQAGIDMDVNWVSTGTAGEYVTTYFAWWEAVGTNCPQGVAGGCPVVPAPSGYAVKAGDIITITVGSSGGVSTLTMNDNHWSSAWLVSEPFTADPSTADWALEGSGSCPSPTGCTVGFFSYGTAFSQLGLNGVNLALVAGSYCRLWNANIASSVSGLSGGSDGTFSVSSAKG